MKRLLGYIGLAAFITFAISSCANSVGYGTMKPLQIDQPWINCSVQKQLNEPCQTFPYWKQHKRTRLA